MPDKDVGQEVGGEPQGQPSMQSPAELSGNQRPPSYGTNVSTSADEERPKYLRKIAAGETWLIGIGVCTLILNGVLGVIYYGQLVQMRAATNASTKAVEIASETLQTSTSNFDRAQRQTISQTFASIEAANAAKSAADTAREQLTLSQRPFIKVSNPIACDASVDIDGFLNGCVDLDIENVGATPARVISIRTEFVELGKDIALLHKFCTGAPYSASVKSIIFPKDKLPPIGYPNVFDFKKSTMVRIPPLRSGEYAMPGAFVGCVQYKSFFTNEIYYTGFNYHVSFRTIDSVLFDGRNRRVTFIRSLGPTTSNIGTQTIPRETIGFSQELGIPIDLK